MKNSNIVLLGMFVSMTATAEDGGGLSAGFDYSSGKYGNAESTIILYVPVTGKYITDNLTLSLTVPYISITGPGGIVRGMGRIGMTGAGGSGGMGGGMASAGAGAAKTTNSGLGDITASADYTIFSTDTSNVNLVSGIKFGTADENKGLGTGRNDYSVQIDGYRGMNETALFATLGYKIYGSPPGVDFNNVPYGTIGASWQLDSGKTVGGMFEAAKSPSGGVAGRRELSAYVTHMIAPGTRISANILKGFSDASPDIGVGILVSHIY
ncbi:MAG: transporter [Nitrosomonadales bacterium]|nr:transporter [Nitrosomonadales bacterium]